MYVHMHLLTGPDLRMSVFLYHVHINRTVPYCLRARCVFECDVMLDLCIHILHSMCTCTDMPAYIHVCHQIMYA